MKTKPSYSTVQLYKNEISMLEYYKSVSSDNLEYQQDNFLYNKFSSFTSPVFGYIKYLETSANVENYNKKIEIQQKKIKDLEEHV